MKDQELKSLVKNVKRHFFLAIFAAISLLLIWFIVAVMVVIWVFNMFVAPQLIQERTQPEGSNTQNPIQRSQQWLNQRLSKDDQHIEELQLQINELKHSLDQLKQASEEATSATSSASPL